MPATVETVVYTFDELPDESAKERARDWYRGLIESDELADHDDWEAVAAILGITFKTRPVNLMGGGVRHEPCVYWSGFASQGDGASWEGSYRYAKQAPRRIRAYAPQDDRLHRIADDLAAIQRRNGYRLTATVTTSGPYSHSGTMDVEVSRGDAALGNGWDYSRNRYAGDDAAAVRDALRSFADWIYRQLESQWEHLNSAEAVDESINANGYTFTVDGRYFG